MAVPEQTSYIEHTGNGATTSFALKFQCESKDHLIVLIDDIEPPIATWSLTGGNVVFTTAPAAGKKITLQRNTPFGRTTDYQSFNNSFRPQTVNSDFDRLWLKLQELGVADWLMKLYVDRLHQQQEEKINDLKGYVDDRDDELRAYLMEEIRKQGVALDQLDEYYNYLMQRLAQIAVDKGWDASFVVDGDKTQKQINAALMDGNAYVEFFGDTTIDATNAINMCLLYCQTYNKVAKSVHGKTYTLNDTVIVPTNCDFSGSEFVFPTALNKPAVEIKRMSGANQVLIENVSIKLPSIANNRKIGQIPAAGGRGVKISGLRDSEVVFNSIRGFEENIEMFSDTGNIYISYNDFRFLGMVDASKVNIHINVEGGGWINECTWYRGHFARYTADTTAFGTTCLKISKAAGGNNAPNGHVFFACSMEGAFTKTIDFNYDPALTTSFFSANKWISCRFEDAHEFKFSAVSLYDTFISCMISPHAVFTNDVTPIMLACTRHAKFSLDGADDIGTTRRTTKSHFFESKQSASNMALSVGISGQLNFAVTSSGALHVFSPSDPLKLWGIAKLYSRGGVPALAFGDGFADAPESLFRNNIGDWRIEASLSPTVAQTGTRDLGYANATWRTLYAVKTQLSGGIGAFGVTPPTTKRSITGKKTPTTIAEQNAVLDSIVSALVAYGLVSDDRTV
ncbi:hypothetical protein [Acinetobacter sp. YH01006]|uniref:hypothetical protein n=1 Tax=Acinetobacter sp. YH01006 TaxID=2601022 RepID=UPI0015D3B783|nr:hypothetical protein [Acinetobacter sp. YH01006]